MPFCDVTRRHRHRLAHTSPRPSPILSSTPLSFLFFPLTPPSRPLVSPVTLSFYFFNHLISLFFLLHPSFYLSSHS